MVVIHRYHGYISYRTENVFDASTSKAVDVGPQKLNTINPDLQLSSNFVQNHKTCPKTRYIFIFYLQLTKRADPRVRYGIIFHIKYAILVVSCLVVGNLKFCRTISYKHTLYDQPMYI